MFCRRIAFFVCFFVAAVVATVHNESRYVTGSDLEVTFHPLTTENPESSTRQPDQQVTESTAVDLGALLDAGDGAVVTLVTGDTRLAAHKAVLTARSPMFAATLQRMTLEASSGQLDIPDVEGPVLRHLLAYMYTLQAPQLPGIASQLLVAADTYGLSGLKAHCEQQVAAQLSVETAVTAALLAVRHSCSSLLQAAVAFIRTHIFRVMATQEWGDAMISQPDDLTEVIRLLSEPPAEASTLAPAASRATPAAQPHSDHSGRSTTAASAAPTTTARHTPTPDYDAVSRLRSLSAKEKNSRLRKAAKEGAVQEVVALLAAGADVGAGDEDMWTALHFAAREGHVEVARRLLAAGAAVDARDRQQWTPLHRAAEYGRTAVVRLLVQEASADVNARSDSRRTPLHEAALYGHAEAVAALLQAGANRRATDRWGNPPLYLAIERKHQQVVDMLKRSKKS